MQIILLILLWIPLRLGTVQKIKVSRLKRSVEVVLYTKDTFGTPESVLIIEVCPGCPD